MPRGGRPLMPRELKLVSMTFSLTPEQADEICRRAVRERVSASQVIRLVLADVFRNRKTTT